MTTLTRSWCGILIIIGIFTIVGILRECIKTVYPFDDTHLQSVSHILVLLLKGHAIQLRSHICNSLQAKIGISLLCIVVILKVTSGCLANVTQPSQIVCLLTFGLFKLNTQEDRKTVILSCTEINPNNQTSR